MQVEYDLGGATLDNEGSITALEVVPEPDTAALVVASLLLLGAVVRRRAEAAGGRIV